MRVNGTDNPFDNSDVPEQALKWEREHYMRPVHLEYRVKKTKWVVARYPSSSMAQQARMSREAFAELYYDVCNLDWERFSRAMDPLQRLMERTDRVRLTARDTDVTFSIKDIGVVKCDGRMNLPDGEVFTAQGRVNDLLHGRLEGPVLLLHRVGVGVGEVLEHGEPVDEAHQTLDLIRADGAGLGVAQGAVLHREGLGALVRVLEQMVRPDVQVGLPTGQGQDGADRRAATLQGVLGQLGDLFAQALAVLEDALQVVAQGVGEDEELAEGVDVDAVVGLQGGDGGHGNAPARRWAESGQGRRAGAATGQTWKTERCPTAWAGAPPGGRQSWGLDHAAPGVIRAGVRCRKAREDAGLGLPGRAPHGSVWRRRRGVG